MDELTLQECAGILVMHKHDGRREWIVDHEEFCRDDPFLVGSNGEHTARKYLSPFEARAIAGKYRPLDPKAEEDRANGAALRRLVESGKRWKVYQSTIEGDPPFRVVIDGWVYYGRSIREVIDEALKCPDCSWHPCQCDRLDAATNA